MIKHADDRPLLALSVYAPGSEKWLDRQRQWLECTSGSFELAVWLNNLHPRDFAGKATVVGFLKTVAPCNFQHCTALKSLTDYARSVAAHYRGFVILDSDCFPVSCGWEDDLWRSMEGYPVAAVVRTENLDTFPHPCAVYARDPNHLRFHMAETVNLLGRKVTDVVLDATSFFPLVRTNRVNLHPIVAGLYYDTFYHHGCGSRAFGMRTFDAGYYFGNYDYDKLEELAYDMPALLKRLKGE